MGHIARLAAFGCLASMTVMGCGRDSTQEVSDINDGKKTHSTSPISPPVAEQAQHAANVKLQQCVALAKVHLKHDEFDEAETVLIKALADSASTEKNVAIALLDQVKTTKKRHSNTAKPPKQDEGNRKSTQRSAKLQIRNSKKEKIQPSRPLTPTTAIRNSQPKKDPALAEKNRTKSKRAKSQLATRAEQKDIKQKARDHQPQKPVRKKVASKPIKELLSIKLQIRKLTLAAKRSRTAKESLDLYESFVNTHVLSKSQEKQLDTQIKIWKSRADLSLLRFGKKWITPAEAKKKKEEADVLILQAIELISVRDFKRSRGLLIKASKVDKIGIRADFILGFLNSIPGFSHPKTAEKHFKTVLERVPNHIPALNNLALAEVKRRKFPQAFRHWKQLVALTPRNQNATHNLGRFISEASKRKLKVRRVQLNKFSDLYSNTIAAKKGTPANIKVGWRYSFLIVPEVEKSKGQKKKDKKDGDKLVAVWSGSGFVFHRHYILTNRHVVKDEMYGTADLVKIVDPTDPDHLRELKATVVAISNDLDVAILKCETLQSPPVRVSSEIPRRGSEIMVLGYPREKLLGRGIKTTKGIITALPAPDHYNMLLFDAEANPGNSGGPVCNDRGVVVALMTIVISPTGGKYTGGVPTAHIIKFIQKHVPGFQIAKGKAPKIEWPDVDAKVSQSTVMLVSYYKGTAFGLDVAASKSQKSINYFEDKTCTVCKGHAHLRCPNNGCHKGAITIKVLQKKVVVNKLGFRNIITTPRFFKKPCPVCHGRDRVDCPHCTTGLDPTL